MKKLILSLLTLSALSLNAGVTTNKVSLAWCYNDEPNLTYRVYIGTNMPNANWFPTIYESTNCPAVLLDSGINFVRTYSSVIDVGNTNFVTLSNFLAGTTYYFAVSASNTVDRIESWDKSDEVRYTIPVILTPPEGFRIYSVDGRLK